MQAFRLNDSPKRTLIAALFLMIFALTARAQVVGGTISGTATDPTGAVVPNAHVLVHNDDTGTQRTLTTSWAATTTAKTASTPRQAAWLFDGRVGPFVAQFSEREKLTPADIAELKRLISEFEDGE